MQPLVDATYRSAYTAAQVQALLLGDVLETQAGLDLLDGADNWAADLSPNLLAGSLERQNYATIHGTCSLDLDTALVWGSDRVRPYLLLAGSGLPGSYASPLRWDLGVYVLTTPKQPAGATPTIYSGVQGADKLYLLAAPVGDTYVVPSGTAVLTAAQAAITAGGGGSKVLFDQTAAGKTLPADKVYPVTAAGSSTPTTWLDVVNDLLATVGYRGLWADWGGWFRSEPYQDPAVRGAEFSFSNDDATVSVLAPARTVTRDLWAAPNWWRFIASNWPAAPAEGAGQYTVQNLSDGPSSQAPPPAGVGRVVRDVQYLQAADQASLQAQGDNLVAAAKRVTTTLDVGIGPFPPSWHFDVYQLADEAAGGTARWLAHSWKLDLAGADGTQTWERVG